MPAWLINVAVHHLAFYFLELLAQTSKTVPGSVFEQRIKADETGFYRFLATRLALLGFAPGDLA